MLGVAAVLAVGRGHVLVGGGRRRGLERAGRETDNGRGGGGRGWVEGAGGVHVLVRAHLLPEPRPAVAEPHLYPGLGQFGPRDKRKGVNRVSTISP